MFAVHLKAAAHRQDPIRDSVYVCCQTATIRNDRCHCEPEQCRKLHHAKCGRTYTDPIRSSQLNYSENVQIDNDPISNQIGPRTAN